MNVKTLLGTLIFVISFIGLSITGITGIQNAQAEHYSEENAVVQEYNQTEPDILDQQYHQYEELCKNFYRFNYSKIGSRVGAISVRECIHQEFRHAELREWLKIILKRP